MMKKKKNLYAVCDAKSNTIGTLTHRDSKVECLAIFRKRKDAKFVIGSDKGLRIVPISNIVIQAPATHCE